jgi:hypothetical protein
MMSEKQGAPNNDARGFHVYVGAARAAGNAAAHDQRRRGR